MDPPSASSRPVTAWQTRHVSGQAITRVGARLHQLAKHQSTISDRVLPRAPKPLTLIMRAGASALPRYPARG